MSVNISIAGFSENFLALLIQCLHRHHQGSLSIEIGRNRPTADGGATIPFAMTGDRIIFVPPDGRQWYLGVGMPQSKRSVVREFHGAGAMLSLTDPSCHISETSTIGTGSILLENVVIAPFTRIGAFVTINRQSSVGHHTTIGDYCTISPGVHIAGHCTIADGVFLGIGSVVCDHLTIGADSVIGAGAVVTRSIPSNVVAYGNPARVIRTIERSCPRPLAACTDGSADAGADPTSTPPMGEGNGARRSS